jgi:RNA polymerase sigma-70 factor (ECF subfamily)
MESASRPAPAALPRESERAQRDARVRAIVESHFDSVWRALKRLGVPEAGVDDAAQQVFLVASRRLDEIDPRGERPYLLGVALRVAADARRALLRRREVPMDETAELATIAPVGPTLEDLLDEKQALRLLGAHLARLPDEMREAFVLFELEELPAPEVANLLGVPVGTVASRVRRARDSIRQHLIRKRGPS